jgi:predicted PhzF superfamily epimerase YddE/YHI9
MLDVDEWLLASVFGDAPEAGNPAVVVRLAAWPDDAMLAAWTAQWPEREVTFTCIGCDGSLRMRWFGPHGEVPNCGHGAMAAAAALEVGHDGAVRVALGGPRAVPLQLTQRAGFATIGLSYQPLYELALDTIDVGVPVTQVFDAGRDYLAVVADEATLRAYVPDLQRLMQLDRIGLIITAPHVDAGACLRFFAPRAGIAEDFASASAVPALVAYWMGAGHNDAVFIQCAGTDVTIPARLAGGRVFVSGRVYELARGRLGSLPRRDRQMPAHYGAD